MSFNVIHKQFTHCVAVSVKRKYIQPLKIIVELLTTSISSILQNLISTSTSFITFDGTYS